MPIRDKVSSNAIRQRFAQSASAQTPQDSAKPVVREYINPTDPEAIVLAAKKRDNRTRAQRPSTPPRLDSPMPSFTLETGNADLAELNLSNSIYMSAGETLKSPRSPLFFPIAVQGQPLLSSFQQTLPGQEMSAGEVDTLARNIPQSPLAQGSRVSVLRKLKEKPTSTVLDMSDPLQDTEASDEIAAIINAGSTEDTLIDSAHFAGAAVALRRRLLRPSALNLAAIATSTDSDTLHEPIAPRAPRKRLTFLSNAETKKDQELGSDLEAELNNNPLHHPSY